MKRNTAIFPGDVVTIDPRIAHCEGHPFDIRVTEVEERYGVIPNSDSVDHAVRGKYQNHLVRGIRLENNELCNWHDFSFVTAIVSRNPATPTPVNIFKNVELGDLSFENTKGTWSGALLWILVAALGSLPYEIKRKINMNRAEKLFFQDKPGLIGFHRGIICLPIVRKKAIQKWVRRNWTRLIYTVDEMNKIVTEEMAHDLQMMENDFGDWLDEDDELEIDYCHIFEMFEDDF